MQCMSSSSRIISEMLPEIHKKKYDYLKSIIHSLIILFSLCFGKTH